jgi:hypothetical protein
VSCTDCPNVTDLADGVVAVVVDRDGAVGARTWKHSLDEVSLEAR